LGSSPHITTGFAAAFTIPTDAPEGDGTFLWDSTTMVLVELACGDVKGVGYTYTHSTAAPLAQSLINEVIVGSDPFQANALFSRLLYKQRNYGRSGIAACALSAIDIALWDLRSKLMDQPLVHVLGQMREAAPVYGSGGFTTYTDAQLRNQLSGWISDGISRVKMKIGQHPEDDLRRIAVAREAIGPDAELFIDANGAYSRKQALDMAHRARGEYNVTWFEEPVTSDDLDGLHLIRNSGPAGMEIAAGEYGFDAMYLKRMITAEAVDVIQADATRCGGITGFMDAAALADAHPLPLSAHCAPSLHLHVACAARPLRHVEYFHDHLRIEKMLFDGFRDPVNGAMSPDLSSAGLGLVFKREDAEQFRVGGAAR
jgi:L-alanine-DL-glutamate epimerase-like enolase superfamily enzyme